MLREAIPCWLVLVSGEADQLLGVHLAGEEDEEGAELLQSCH